MAAFTPLNTDFASQYAQLQADKEKQDRNQQMAQAMMQTGYVPNSGWIGALAPLLGAFMGKRLQRQGDEKVSDLLKREFELQGKQSEAQYAQKMAEEDRKYQRDLEMAQKKAVAEAQAKRDYAEKRFQDGGVFDPATGAYTPDAGYQNAQLTLAQKKAQIEAANRQPTEYQQRLSWLQQHGTPQQVAAFVAGQQGGGQFADINAALQGNIITPEQAKQAIQEKVGVASKPQPVSADNRTKLGLLTAAEQALHNYEKNGTEKGVPSPWANAISGPANAQLDEAIANVLRVESGAAIGKDEIAQARNRYAPGFFGKDETNKAKLDQFRQKIADMKQAILQGTGDQGAPQQPSQAPAAHYVYNAKTGKLEPVQ